MVNLYITLKNIFIQNQLTNYEVGLIDPITKYLTNITLNPALIIVVEQGEVVLDQANGTIIPLSFGTIVIRISYTSYSNTVSLWAIPPIIFPKQQDMTKLLYKYLPPNAYTDSKNSVVYSKNNATAYILSQLYFNDSNMSLQYVLDNTYPPFSSSYSWEQELNNNYPWEGSYDYNLVIQTVRNLFTSIDCNYDCCLLISKYIWARFGRAVYVYIEETNSIFFTKWVLGASQLGLNTTLYDGSLGLKDAYILIQDPNPDFYTDSVMIELTNFIKKIFPADVQPEGNNNYNIVIVDSLASAKGLVIDIRDTYRTDPRLLGKFAIQYSSDAVYDALALITPYNPIFITSFSISPGSNTSAPLGPPVPMTATLIYTYNNIDYPLDVTTNSVFVSSDETIYTISGSSAVPGPALGSSTITAIYLNPLGSSFNITTSVVYNINSGFWVLGTSSLGATTTLQ